MSAPKPKQIKALCKDIQNLASVVALEFEWTSNAAYDRTVRDEPKVNTGGRTDPTGSVVVSKAFLRRACERAYRDLRSIESQLRSIEVTLGKALEGTEPRERPEPHFPRTASPDDIEASRDAQARRKAAGEMVP